MPSLLQQVPHGLEVVGLLLVSGAIVLTGLDREDAPTTEAPAAGVQALEVLPGRRVGAVRARDLDGVPGGRDGPAGSCRRIPASWPCAAICWATSAVWMPWNSPSSQPTSCACAIRSSASDGAWSSTNGSVIRCSSATSSGDRPSSSSCSDRSWISASRARAASSRGALRTSSRSCLIIVPIRMTFAGWPTSEMMSSGWSSSGTGSSTSTRGFVVGGGVLRVVVGHPGILTD